MWQGNPDGQTELLKDPIPQEHVGQIDKDPEFVESRKSEVRKAAFSFKPKMRRVKLESSNLLSDFLSFAQEHSNQLERFLEILVQADQRLVGSAVGHRIQIVDCTVGGEFGVEPLMEAVYGRLSAILAQRDPWETRLDEVEAFVEEHGRCPKQKATETERVLGTWFDHQREAIRSQQIPAHRLQRLLNVSSPVIRRRVEGWVAGGFKGTFERNCRELKQYIETHGALPTKRKYRLAVWLNSLRTKPTFAKSERKKMLEQVHPLMKELVHKWSSTPFKRIDVNRWKNVLKCVVDFHQLNGRLPRCSASESKLYWWLDAQQQRLTAGFLPKELAKQLMAATEIWDEKVGCGNFADLDPT